MTEFTKEEFEKVFEIFKVECDEHLQKINAGLMDLEKDPQNTAYLNELFREAHSLKGAGRIMGFFKIEKISHGIENILDGLRRGELKINSVMVDAIYVATDMIGKILQIVSEKRNEEGIEIEDVENKLNNIFSVKGEIKLKEEVKPKPPLTKDNLWERRSSDVPKDTSLNRRNKDTLVINTLRVATSKLDFLMNQVDELLLARIRGGQRLAEFQDIRYLIEDWNKQIKSLKSGIQNKENQAELDMMDFPQMQKFNQFYEKCFDYLIRLINKTENFEMDLLEDNQKLGQIVMFLEDTTRKLRMLPVYTAVETFPRMVRDLCQKNSKEIEFELVGGDTELDKKIIEEIKDPLMHLVLNSFDHGIEMGEERERAGKSKKGKITLSAKQKGNSIVIELSDDGKGIDTERIKELAIKRGLILPEKIKLMQEQQIWDLIFKTGFSTSKVITNISGRGVGMDIVRNNIERLKGHVSVESIKGKGTKFIITLPLTLATLHVLLVELNHEIFALPSANIETTLLVFPADIFTIEGREAIDYKNNVVPLISLADLLSLKNQSQSVDKKINFFDKELSSVIILTMGEEKIAVFVDKIAGEQEAVLKNMGSYLKRVKNVIGATLLGDGRICIILNPADLIRQIKVQDFVLMQKIGGLPEEEKKNILLVDDSITTRTFEKNILEAVGYAVDVAFDGEDAFQKIREKDYHLVITDVEMPLLDGFSLTQKIKQDAKYKDLPVILVTSLDSEENKKKGVEAGAEAYITKGSFDRSDLLATIQRLI